jgi:FKBP-type peptidyl-prolyl cis-trans isomerase FkpA
MLRLLICLLLTPAVALAQGATAAQKPSTPGSATAKPAPPKAAAPVTAAPKPSTAGRAPARAVAPLTDEQKTVYALGLLMQRSLGQFDLTAAELDVLKRALSDAAAGKPAIDIDQWGPKVEAFAGARAERVVAREKVASAAYLAKAAAEPGVVRTDSGLIYRDLSAGTGGSPAAGDAVTVHYRGTLINGTEFDSSYRRNEPAQFRLNAVIPCWTEGVQKMKVGGKARLVCPSDLAYGDAGRPSIPGGATLVFEVELLEIAAAAPQ